MNPDRIVIGSFDDAARRPGRGAVRGLRRADRPDERPLRGDDQARRERLPRDQDQLHQRDRERLRGGRRRRGRGRGRHGPRPAHRDELPPAGHRLRRACFPKDVSFLKLLAGNSGYHFQLVSAVIEVNDLQKRRVVAKLQARSGSCAARRSPLLGLAFKPNTDDMREAPSIVLASRLLAEGADVRAWDPLVESHPELDGVDDRGVAARRGAGRGCRGDRHRVAGARILASEEVREAMRTPLIVDGRNLLDPEAVRAAGFDYEGIGRALAERIPLWKPFSSPAARASGSATPHRGGPKSLVPDRGPPARRLPGRGARGGRRRPGDRRAARRARRSSSSRSSPASAPRSSPWASRSRSGGAVGFGSRPRRGRRRARCTR